VGVKQQSPNTPEYKDLPEGLGGDANEAEVEIEGIPCEALLDTGATISTVSEKFYKESLPGLELHELKSILKIDCANGQLLPYYGYIEVKVCVPGLTGTEGVTTIVLVTPESHYNKRVPLLLGTNLIKSIMDDCKEQAGPKFLQRMALSTPWWVAFQYMSTKERALSRSKGKVGLVKCAFGGMVRVPSNKTVTVRGYVTDSIPYKGCAMLHQTKKTVLPDGVEILPTLVDFQGEDDVLVAVDIANVTRYPVSIPSRALLCELQLVDMADEETDTEPDMDEQGARSQVKMKAQVAEMHVDMENQKTDKVEDTDTDTKPKSTRNRTQDDMELLSRFELEHEDVNADAEERKRGTPTPRAHIPEDRGERSEAES
jgi:hypothetical protein